MKIEAQRRPWTRWLSVVLSLLGFATAAGAWYISIRLARAPEKTEVVGWMFLFFLAAPFLVIQGIVLSSMAFVPSGRVGWLALLALLANVSLPITYLILMMPTAGDRIAAGVGVVLVAVGVAVIVLGGRAVRRRERSGGTLPVIGIVAGIALVLGAVAFLLVVLFG